MWIDVCLVVGMRLVGCRGKWCVGSNMCEIPLQDVVGRVSPAVPSIVWA